MAGTQNAFDFWSKINSLDVATKASREGFVAALICAAITTALVIAGQFGFTPIPGVTLLALIDAAIYAGLGYGIYRYSRVCAVLGLVFYCFEQYFNVKNLGAFNVVMIMLFIVFFLRGIRGTFAYHRLKRNGVMASHEA